MDLPRLIGDVDQPPAVTSGKQSKHRSQFSARTAFRFRRKHHRRPRGPDERKATGPPAGVAQDTHDSVRVNALVAIRRSAPSLFADCVRDARFRTALPDRPLCSAPFSKARSE
jgi:hypothetical protein